MNTIRTLVPEDIRLAYWKLFHMVPEEAGRDRIVCVGGSALTIRRVEAITSVITFAVGARVYEVLKDKTLPDRVELVLGTPMNVDKTDTYFVPTETVASLRSKVESKANGGDVLASFTLRSIDKYLKDKEPKEVQVKVKTWAEGELTEEERVFEASCQKQNWYYGFSDDLSVYKAGEASDRALLVEKDRIGGNAKAIYEHYSK